MADFFIGQGDTASTFADTLKDAAGAAVDIAGATVTLSVRPAIGGAAIVNAAAASNDQVGNGSDGSKGKVSFAFSAAQTAVAGTYLAAWTVTFANGRIQAFPNGAYILIEITADAPISTATMFATTADLSRRLGIELIADEHVRASHLLALASGIIQRETRQKIAKVTGETLTVPGSYASRFRLPERPVVSVASVTLNGKALISGTDWYLDSDELVRKNGGWGKPSIDVVVVYTHGYDSIPETVKAVCMEMVVRAWVNPGNAQSQAIGSESATFAATGLMLTDAERGAVRAAVARAAGSMRLR